MSDSTVCRRCDCRIWWEESASGSRWVSVMNGSLCVNDSGHEPEKKDELIFDAPDDAAVITAELLIVGYVREDGSNGFMVHARGDMPSTTYLGLTVLAQDEIKEWGR